MAESWDHLGLIEERVQALEKVSHEKQEVVPAAEIQKMVASINAEFATVAAEFASLNRRLEDLERQARY